MRVQQCTSGGIIVGKYHRATAAQQIAESCTHTHTLESLKLTFGADRSATAACIPESNTAVLAMLLRYQLFPLTFHMLLRVCCQSPTTVLWLLYDTIYKEGELQLKKKKAIFIEITMTNRLDIVAPFNWFDGI